MGNPIHMIPPVRRFSTAVPEKEYRNSGQRVPLSKFGVYLWRSSCIHV